MLSWNYWVGDGYVLAASPDGRPKGQFLSNAICPSNGADINGPTANANSSARRWAAKCDNGDGDWAGYLNSLPNGASHTMTFNPSLLRDPEHKAKFKAFLRGYAENGGHGAADQHSRSRHAARRAKASAGLPPPAGAGDRLQRLLHQLGKELQDEVIARLSHAKF
jgi:formate C-acetyltransferase